jgi:hypothetical protein
VVEVTDLWFPADGIVCRVEDDYGRQGPMRAFYGKPRGVRLSGTVEVPREVYERIRKLAKLTRQADRLAARLGSDAAVKGLFAREKGARRLHPDFCPGLDPRERPGR